MPQLSELIELLDLEQTSPTEFIGHSIDIGSGRVYGGQVLGQAISAAQKTIEKQKATDKRNIHSAHAYFLRAGDLNVPITYKVDITRDGNSYSSRTVTARQNDKTIFTLMCSFQKPEQSSLNYCERIDSSALYKKCDVGINLKGDPSIKHHFHSQILSQQPFLMRLPNEDENNKAPLEYFCIKPDVRLPNDAQIQQPLMAYISDLRLLPSSLRSTPYRFRLDEIMLATICHGIWFHRECNLNEWLFVICEPLSLSNGRGLAKGSMYNHEGELVATSIQEGVVRLIRK